MHSTSENDQLLQAGLYVNRRVFGDKIGLIASLFGCWHKRKSCPFPEKGETYISCLDCGARKKFDPCTLTTTGSFHYPPDVL